MEKFFNPKSVAVIGVSESPANMAKNIVGNLLEFGFKGIIYQVGKTEGTLFSRKIYRSVLEIEDSIDLAVILTPAAAIPQLMEECGKKNIHNIVIESAGFGEFGEKGKELEKTILKIAKKYSIRFIGPNCIGTMDLASGLATSFVSFKNTFKRDGISIISQSGGVGFSYITTLASENLGISKFASIGNKLNVNENDLLEYLIDDPETKIICIYLEGISDGRKLLEIAKRSPKPILVQKANTGSHAKSIAESHTAALSSDDKVVDAALKQSGIARILDRETLVNYLKIMPLPKMRGNKLAIISRSGGHAIIAADVSEQEGFELAALNKNFLHDIEKHLRAKVIRLTNPIDIGDLFDYGVYAEIIEKTLKQPNIDGVVFMHAYFSETEGTPSRVLFNKIKDLSYKYDKPVGICIATDEDEFSRLRKELDYPLFNVPSAVVRALALSRDFYLKRSSVIARSEVTKQSPANNCTQGIATAASRPRNDKTAKILRTCLSQKRNPSFQEGMEIFKAYGIPIVKTIQAKNADEAVRAAAKIGYPVVMKISSQKISHKTDVGGVKLNIKNESQLREEHKAMMKTLFQTPSSLRKQGSRALTRDSRLRGNDNREVIIQPMLKKGWELILGAKQDPNFGPVVLAGLGGIFVEIFKDTTIRVVPIDKDEPAKMLSELKGYAILQGARGDKPYDIKAAEAAISKLARLIADFPEIKEIDINPFYVLHKGGGGFALDARVILFAPRPVKIKIDRKAG
ncbi:MAG: acetate--CoA ligase family protein [Deltaproteobacteria bacterium]|nr:acetate--CoA ligase family protein [Deltaproteobacteria bacterium]